MPAMILGGPNGTQLGGSKSGTLGTAATNWTLDGRELANARATAETATATTLTLTWRVTSRADLRTLRTLKRDEGKVSTLSTDDGGHRAIDRANGSNTHTLTPPGRRQPLRTTRTVHVERYEEDLISQTAREWSVEVEFAVAEPRGDNPTIILGEQADAEATDTGTQLGGPNGLILGTENGGTLGTATVVPADTWGFETPQGTLVTDRVDADVVGTGEGGVRRYDLTARFDKRQATTFESAFKRIRGSRVKEVPDAPNVMVDELDGDLTVSANAPDDQNGVDDGAYVLTEWQSTRVNDRYQSVEFTIAEK